MTEDPHRTAAREIAFDHLHRGDALGWFDALYRSADGNTQAIPWADLKPNTYLVDWLHRTKPIPRQALVLGCGLGDDAEFLASLGFSVVAFDISAEAIRWARKRFPHSKVDYRVANLLDAPGDLKRRFDLVVEIFTLQALPDTVRTKAFPIVADFVGPEGRLFLFARGRDESDPPGDLPWPLTPREIAAFEEAGLLRESFENFLDDEDPPVRRFRAVFSRAGF